MTEIIDIMRSAGWLTIPACSTIALVVGVILDFILGDPNYAWHPIRLIGSLIAYLERQIRRQLPKTAGAELCGGTVLVIFVLSISVAIPSILLFLFYQFHIFAGIALESIFSYQLLAAKSLRTESMKVEKALRTKGLSEGRRAVSMIVGRDTDKLDETGVIKAAIETVAENTSDGVIAPLLFMAVLGAPAGFFYKAVNTMDSMIGYQNNTYLYFGRAAARLDDICNYIPARISALLMIVISPFFGCSCQDAYRIWRRDSRNHKSPNSAQTEAVCAGALGIQLAGDAWYFGKLHKKPYIGDDDRPIESQDIRRVNRLMYVSSAVMLVIACTLKIFIFWGIFK